MPSSTITSGRARQLRERFSELMRIREFRGVFQRVEALERAKEELLDINRLQSKQLALSDVHVARLEEVLKLTETVVDGAHDELKQSGELVKRLKELQVEQRSKTDDLEGKIDRLTIEITEVESWAKDLLAKKQSAEDRVEELETRLEKACLEKERAESRAAELEDFFAEKGIEVPGSLRDSE